MSVNRIRTAHLHCHTIYSIQDAMPQVKDYVNAIYEQNQNSSKYEVVGLAVTDHGSLSGIGDEYSACRNPDDPNKKIKDIYGFETYHCLDLKVDPSSRYHLVLLAETEEGLHNIYEIASHAGTHLYKGRSKNFPVTDLDFLKTHGKGITALSACLGGVIPKCITSGNMVDADAYALMFNKVFDHFYLEVQATDNPDQLMVNSALVDMSKRLNIPLVITSDSHYIYKEQRKYHDILKDISHQLHFTDDGHLRTFDEFENYCVTHGIPLDCISNTGVIADRCNTLQVRASAFNELFPVSPCPPGYDGESYLRKLCFEKLPEKLVKNNIQEPEKYIKQMLYELDVICGDGYADYFLILWDWFEWCRQNGILCGPGRGSAAGSIVSYVLNITKVDPIKNGFIFERFLCKGRISPPDIDTDIPRDRRADAIEYLKNKYGIENVSQIVTFGKYKLKNTTKAILSNLGVPFADQNNLTRGIPDMIDGKEVTWDLIENVHNNPDADKYSNFSDGEKAQLENIYQDFQNVFNKYPAVYDGIKSICGCIANTGIHAGGVIVCKVPIGTRAQIVEPTGKAVLPVIQLQMSDLENFSFLKIDALGLKTLDVIKLTMDLTGGLLDYDWYDSEDYSDPKVYEMLRNGDTTDVFQMSGFMATKMIADFDVRDIEGLSAVNAGNRPGPLEKDAKTGKSMVDLYVERRQSGVIPSIDPRIDPLLEKTFGCIWYQEDCINLGKIMAGYSPGDADIRIRKTLGKKKVKIIPEIRNEFIYGKASKFNDKHEVIGMDEKASKYCSGALDHGFTLEVSEQIFNSMEAFAKYSFNMSHSFCYGTVAYKTAWLSCYYPVEFAVANCTINEDSKAIVQTLSLAKKRKIPILGPDINKSGSGFTCEQVGVKEGIRYGLKAIKGVGDKVVQFIEGYRKDPRTTDFVDFNDFYNKVHDESNPVVAKLLADMRQETGKNSPNPMRKDVELALIFACAFDYYEPDRYKLAQHYLINIKREKQIAVKIGDTTYTQFPKYTRKEKLMLEKEFMGTYISEHPLDSFTYQDFDDTQEGGQIKTTVLVVSAALKTTKKGKQYLSVKGVDKTDTEITINLFDEEKSISLKNDLKKNSIFIIDGNVSHKFNNINAKTAKIAAKQPVYTENITIEEQVFVPEEPAKKELVDMSNPLADIFG